MSDFTPARPRAKTLSQLLGDDDDDLAAATRRAECSGLGKLLAEMDAKEARERDRLDELLRPTAMEELATYKVDRLMSPLVQVPWRSG